MADMSGWRYGLFGCFENCTLCIITYFVPCVTAGRNAEMADRGSCIICALASMLGPIGIYCIAKTREAVREKKGIEGSFLTDCLLSWFCPFCSVIQVARELDDGAMGQSISRT